MSKIIGKIAQIVSDREVVLNKGTNDGVEEGMYFKVVDPKTIDVVDPDSGTSLGSITRIKVVLIVDETSDRISILRTFRKNEVNIGGTSNLGNLFAAPKVVSRVETLRRGDDTPAELDPRLSIVKIGDPVEEASASEVNDFKSISLWRDPNDI